MQRGTLFKISLSQSKEPGDRGKFPGSLLTLILPHFGQHDPSGHLIDRM